MLKKFNSTFPGSPDLAYLILRVGTSLLMLQYGYPKFQQLLDGNFAFDDPIGIGEGASLVLTVLAEFFCSILLILGLFTKPSLIFLIATMLVVILVVHAPDPFEKKEHAIQFLIPYIALFLTGPGKFSLDRKLFKQ